MYCKKLFEGLERRLEEKKDIDTIAQELCPDVVQSREKVIRLIKSHMGGSYLVDNYEWLAYNKDNIRNPTGEGRAVPGNLNKDMRLQKPTLRTIKPNQVQYELWRQELDDVYLKVNTIKESISKTTEGRKLWKVNNILKAIKDLRDGL